MPKVTLLKFCTSRSSSVITLSLISSGTTIFNFSSALDFSCCGCFVASCVEQSSFCFSTHYKCSFLDFAGTAANFMNFLNTEMNCCSFEKSKVIWWSATAQKMKFSIKDFFSKWEQFRRKLQIWSHLLKTSWWETSFLCSVLFISGHIQNSLL